VAGLVARLSPVSGLVSCLRLGVWREAVAQFCHPRIESLEVGPAVARRRRVDPALRRGGGQPGGGPAAVVVAPEVDGGDVEQGRFRAEALFEAASRRYRAAPYPGARGPASPAVPEHSGAGGFLGAFERQFDGDSPAIDGGTSPPTCQDVRGKNGSRRCARPALYLGESQWSPGCDKHARTADRERHQVWIRANQDSLDHDCSERARQRQAIGHAVLNWWRETGGPLTAMRDAVEHAGAGD